MGTASFHPSEMRLRLIKVYCTDLPASKESASYVSPRHTAPSPLIGVHTTVS